MDWPVDVFERTLGHIALADPKAVTELPKITRVKREALFREECRRLEPLGLRPLFV